MTSPEIRQQFLDFFKSKGHIIVPSAPIVIKNDPTLLFTNAGMNQFKDYFLGNKTAEYKRVADTQKCLRVSGKHNDLEEVGVDTYHHTMFEMLGNWSFGDYFKKEAIAWSWELLTEVYKLDKERLYVTIFQGDEKEGLEKDEEAFTEWKKYVPEERILLGNKKDNFWEMGDTGPCGPCTEIHFDSRNEEERKANPGASLVNADDPQVIEIWNNVFMQFNRIWNPNKGGATELSNWEKEHKYLLLSTDKNYHAEFHKGRADKHRELTLLMPLLEKHVDTGMGFERLVRVIQKKQSNYDTDVFTETIAEIEKITDKTYRYSDTKQDIAFRVISDHIRTIAFTIVDGQLPSNTGAGYVIRRILRRAVRYYHSYLDFKQPLLSYLIDIISKQFEIIFPELNQQKDFVKKVIKEEEEAFLRTLAKGLEKVENYFDNWMKMRYYIGEISANRDLNDEQINEYIRVLKFISDHQVFKIGGLYKLEEYSDNLFKKRIEDHLLSSYNKKYQQENEFLKEIEIIQNENIPIDGRFAFELYDTYGFPLDLTKLIANEFGWIVDEIGFSTEMQQQKTRSRAATALDTEDWIVLNEGNKTEFIGYDSLETKASILKYRKVKAKGKEQYQIVLDKTPFYAESGGQVGDKGLLKLEDASIHIIDTKKENDLIIHVAEAIPDNINDEVFAIVPKERRQHVASHHTATHLLHAALRTVLGTHVAQKGSLVYDEGLRFDFSHFAKVTGEEIARVEAIVNEKIRENIPVVIRYMSKEDAMQTGAIGLFGEKYGDIVRVVTIDPNYSIELCGGTHVGTTGELGFFKIRHETAVAAGVRRVEAVTGKAADNYIEEQLSDLNKVKIALKNPKELSKSLDNLLAEQSELRKKVESLEAKMLNSLQDELVKKVVAAKDNISFIGEIIDISSADALKKLSIDVSKKINGAAVLCATINGKATVAVALAESLINKGFDANKIIKEQVAPLINGGGGGNKTAAIAGGQNGNHFQQVIEMVKGLL